MNTSISASIMQIANTPHITKTIYFFVFTVPPFCIANIVIGIVMIHCGTIVEIYSIIPRSP